MTKKVLLIGGNTGLGLKINEFLVSKQYIINILSKSELDISNSETFYKSIQIINDFNPDIIILNSFDRKNVNSQLTFLKYLWEQIRYKIKVKIVVISSASSWFFNWIGETKKYADAKRELSNFVIDNGFIKYNDEIKSSLILLEPATIETYKDLKLVSIERDTLILSYEEFFEMLTFCLTTSLRFLRIGGEGNIKI